DVFETRVLPERVREASTPASQVHQRHTVPQAGVLEDGALDLAELFVISAYRKAHRLIQRMILHQPRDQCLVVFHEMKLRHRICSDYPDTASRRPAGNRRGP